MGNRAANGTRSSGHHHRIGAAWRVSLVNDIFRANLIDLPSRFAPKVSYARFILVALIYTCPLILLVDGVIVYGVVAALAAVGVAVVAGSMRPGETQFLISIIRFGATLAAVPALWIVIQILPLRAIAHPIWASAEAAVGHSLAGSVSIDFGASVMALGQYLSAVAVALVAAAVAVDRQRASWILFALMGATALIALISLLHDLAGLTFLNGVGSHFGRAQTIDCTAIGTIVAAAAAIRILERYENRRAEPKRSDTAVLWTFAACSAALVICITSLAVTSTGAAMIATGYGLGALMAVAVIRRLSFGPWGIAAFALPAIGLAVLMVASEPGLRTNGVVLAFAAPSSLALTSASQRILDDTAWTGTGAGTFAAITPIYRNIDDPETLIAPTTAAALSIELGQPMFWLIVAAIVSAVAILLRASLQRGRDSFYPAAGAGCLIALLFLSFMNAGILGTATAVSAAAMLGLALGQSKSRTIQ